jgi:hypothetical protein
MLESMALRLKDLHPVFLTLTQEEAVAVANLGAQAYVDMKGHLYESWLQNQSAEEGAKAEVWRTEGGQAMLEKLQKRLAEGDAAIQRATTLETAVNAEIERRVGEVLEMYKKDFELTKLEEVSVLKVQLAELKGKEHAFRLLAEAHPVMQEKIATLEAQIMEQTVANTKSSHAIGKAGEATVLEILNTAVISSLPYASVKDMTAVGHAADFHLSVMLETGTKAKILVDSKKYKRKVNTTEIEKLYADVDADEQADAGLMISIESHIFTMKQYQITMTPKKKPVLFISFCDLSEDLRKDLTVWAVRILVDMLSQRTSAETESMLANLGGFLSAIDDFMKELDSNIRASTKNLDALKVSRDGLIRTLLNFRAGKSLETPLETAQLEGCSHITKNGGKCGKKVLTGTFCKAHVKKEAE